MASPSLPRRIRKKGKDFWEWLKSFFPKNPDSQKENQRQKQAQPDPSNQDGRYQVQNQSGGVQYADDDLRQALQAWRELTGQMGSIVDTETGEDITPDKDDSGRYAVLDERGEQVGTFESLPEAQIVWEVATNGQGSIIDTLEQKDVTPFKGHLTDEQVEQAIQLVSQLAGSGFSHSDDFYRLANEFDEEMVKNLIPLINKMRLPIFELANAVGSGIDVPTRLVTITKREAIVDTKEVPYYEDIPVDDDPTQYVESPTPQDDHEVRPMRTYGEIVDVNPVDVVRPDFGKRFAQHELPITQHQEEIPGEAPTVRMRRMREEQTIIPREWEEEVEVSDDSRVQNLVIVCDLSGSMFYSAFPPRNIEVAIALCVVLITKHLDDDSRYGFRWFADIVDSPTKGDSKNDKKKLIEFILKASPHDLIGGGTSIISGITTAADDVRRMAKHGEIPEVLLVTDGDDETSAYDVLRAIGTDVVLHTVVVGGGNPSLAKHSTTYETISRYDFEDFGVDNGAYNTRW